LRPQIYSLRSDFSIHKDYIPIDFINEL